MIRIDTQLELNFEVKTIEKVVPKGTIRFTCLWKGDVMYVDFLSGGWSMASFPIDDFNELVELIGTTHWDQFNSWINEYNL